DMRWRPYAGGVRRGCPAPQPPSGQGLEAGTGPFTPATAARQQQLPVHFLCSTHRLGVPALGSPLNCPWCAQARSSAMSPRKLGSPPAVVRPELLARGYL
ncbi:unnamed protein product, partial [Polarella glacialis]